MQCTMCIVVPARLRVAESQKPTMTNNHGEKAQVREQCFARVGTSVLRSLQVGAQTHTHTCVKKIAGIVRQAGQKELSSLIPKNCQDQVPRK
jgi:hypothetical protein